MEQCPSDVVPTIVVVAEVAIGLWIWSVWTWRLRLNTGFRAEGAKNLVQEFQSYGYPLWLLKVVGAVKLTFASLLLVAVVYPDHILTLVASGSMLFLMSAAIFSHLKVGDGLTRFIPAFSMAILSAFVLGADLAGCVNADKPPPPLATRACVVVPVVAACLAMWYRSYRNGDYDLDTYEKLDENLLKA